MRKAATRAIPFIIWLFGAPMLAMAQNYTGLGAPPGRLTMPILTGVTSSSFIGNLVYTIVNWMFWGLIVFSIIMTLVAGYRYLTSAGDPEKISKANKTIVYAAVAVAVALIAQAIPFVVASILGSPLTSKNIL